LSDKAEEKISKFYNTVGWETEGNITEDARQWEDLREFSQEYISKCRLRLLKYIPESGGNILDMASGPIQYPEYLEYSKNFNKRYCVDLSDAALESAKLQQALIPNNKLGKLMLRVLFSLETRFPHFFSKHFTYTMIILTKKKVLK